ncbi:gamma-glutamylcyclotransferase family protein [Lichenicoccus sp.]|uniref:gamma-glutamylcyclotransferase family protein n=1 Tax=Lichenicoccus sp. TaxID=2781899 RepID=UPI003D0D8270
MTSRGEAVFSYGTLQDPAVQQACFGRRLPGDADAIAGYRQSAIAVAEPDRAGTRSYPILDPSSDASDLIAGMVLLLTEAELAQADEYEGPDYRRVWVRTRAGRDAWVYIRA